ncbi:hypothetical protein FKV68_20240 [Sinorhizobium mexicanum]|uniref:Uncharacterized protein n=1 Tax=Sinorhizobium mexicanum TaxID=375549 RepID=A0A859QDS8_9HYPH|nr:hypothetical protein FKV68_20240 [Sinorhizobium mexicanum]
MWRSRSRSGLREQESPLTLALSPLAGRGDEGGAACPFAPLAGRRCRQADEGRLDGLVFRPSCRPVCALKRGGFNRTHHLHR